MKKKDFMYIEEMLPTKKSIPLFLLLILLFFILIKQDSYLITNNCNPTSTPYYYSSQPSILLIPTTLTRYDTNPHQLLQCLQNLLPQPGKTILFLCDSTCTETTMDIAKYLSGITDPMEITLLYALAGSWLSINGNGTGIPHEILMPARGTKGMNVYVKVPGGSNRNITVWTNNIILHNRFMGHILLGRSGMGIESFIWETNWKEEIRPLIGSTAGIVIINSAAHDCLEHPRLGNMTKWFETYPSYYEITLKKGIANIRQALPTFPGNKKHQIFYRSMNPNLYVLKQCVVLEEIAKKVCEEEQIPFLDVGRLVKPFYDALPGKLTTTVQDVKNGLHVGSIKVVLETLLLNKNRFERPKTYEEYVSIQKTPVHVGISDLLTISFLDELCKYSVP
jgi:hypothetical protein